jgi:PAS domain S-box-containing protein
MSVPEDLQPLATTASAASVGLSSPSTRAAAHPGRPAEPTEAQLLDALREHAIFGLDAAGRIVTWSAAAERLTGYSRKDALGQTFSLFSEATDGQQLQNALRTASQAGAYHQERWWRRQDERLVWIDEVINPLEGDGFVVIAHDATERAAQAERKLANRAREGVDRADLLRGELQAAERRASFLAQASSILVATSLDFDSTLKALARLAVSRLSEWCVLHGSDDDDCLRVMEVSHRDPEAEAALDELIAPVPPADWERIIRTVISTGQSQALDAMVTDDWFEANGSGRAAAPEHFGRGPVMITPLTGRGRVLGAITYVAADGGPSYDENDLRLAEELGRRAAIALDNARLYREAQEASRAKGDFLAVISHELRTPLNAIMGYTDLLDAGISGELSEKQGQQIGRIRASARHLLQLIEEILSFARMEAGRDELLLELVSVTELMHEACSVIEPLATEKELEFITDPPEPDVTVETDPGKARQVLVNLLSNAVKFTERGSVRLSAHADGEALVIQVADTGMGIPAEQVRRIFDPFWQAERPNTRKVGGTGLGLSVARRFVRLLRGELSVDSQPGRGATFTVRLPLRLTGTQGAAGDRS